MSRTTIDPQKTPDERFEYYSIPAFQAGQRPIVENGANIRSIKLVVEPDMVLFGKLNPDVPKLWRVSPSESLRQIASTEFFALVPDRSLLSPQFLYYLCGTATVLRSAIGLGQGSTPSRQRVDLNGFLDIRIPLPPLEEQRRIARILSTIQDDERISDAQVAALRDLRRSMVEAALAGQDDVELRSLMERPQYGFTASASVGRPVKFLRITDIQESGIDWSVVPSCDPAPPPDSRYELADGDLVVARIGATTGKAWLMRNPPLSIFASYLIRIRAADGVDPRFLAAYFESKTYWEQIDAAKGDRLKGGVNIENLNSLRVPFISLAEQRKLGEALDAVSTSLAAARKRRVAVSTVFGAALTSLLDGAA
jgi:type I restriction enzyme S subunit